jgi:hypothetical protein
MNLDSAIYFFFVFAFCYPDNRNFTLFFSIRAPSNAHDNAASNLLSGGNLDSMINQLMEMGGGSWDRDKVQRALRAAYNNPERAVEYLYSVCICFPPLYLLNWIQCIVVNKEICFSNIGYSSNS